jgi:2-amino-4-hydroxy-6-hydroxymethyldihydropteridine diphosphokinase
MTTVFLSLGSNIHRESNITAALDSLKEKFGKLTVSSVYQSEAVGFTGDYFYNLVVGIECPLSLKVLSEVLKKIEDENGRLRTGPRFASRTLDIDIITYGSLVGLNSGIELPRPELYYNAFVLWPIAEIVPDLIDIKTGKSYQSLWLEMSQAMSQKTGKAQKLWPIDFYWSGQRISATQPL